MLLVVHCVECAGKVGCYVLLNFPFSPITGALGAKRLIALLSN